MSELGRFTMPQPDRLLNMNDRLHWSVQRRRARAWRTAAEWHSVASMQMAAGRWPAPPVTVHVDIEVPTAARRDPHNLFPTVKAIVDGCTDAGLWPDDTAEWVATTEPRLVVATRKERMVDGWLRALTVTVRIEAR